MESNAFDAWGRPRNANGADIDPCAKASLTTRGFTNQEEIHSACLVNLNARLYDPTIGRFMAADPITATPYDAQSLNRYTYVDNRPLSLTDPTGMDSVPGNPDKAQERLKEGDKVRIGNATITITKINDDGSWSANIATDASTGSHIASVVSFGGPGGRGSNTDFGSLFSQPSEITTGDHGAPAGGNGQGNSKAFDVDAFAARMDKNAQKSSQTACAAYCREGLRAGGMAIGGYPITSKSPASSRHIALKLLPPAKSTDQTRPETQCFAAYRSRKC